jgi:RimJ/RimL family protein N-acetyltransferase
MATIRPTILSDYPVLFEIAMRVEPHDDDFTLERYGKRMDRRAAWTVIKGDRIIGCISISDITPRLNATLHVFVDKDYQRKWLTRDILRTVFGYCFDGLGLERVTGYCIVGLNDDVGRFQERLGFRHEGTNRNAIRLNGKVYDMRTVGMLKSECRWILR